MNFSEEDYWSVDSAITDQGPNRSMCQMDEGSEQIAAQCAYWLEGVLLTIVGVLGILGNIISIIVLASSEMRNSFNLLLSCLATIDILFIIIAVMDYSFAREFCWPFDLDSEIYAILFPKFLFPINNIIFNASIFLTIVIAYERYCAVCRPHDYRDMALSGNTGKRVTGYCVSVITFSALLNIPRFLEMQLVTEQIQNMETGEIRNVTTYIATELRMNQYYMFYYVNGSRLLLTQILPVASLVYFNLAIFRGIKYAHVRSSNRNSSSHNEVNLATVLICIVIMFLLCHSPRLIINVAELIISRSYSACDNWKPPAWFLCLTSFMHWLLIVNSSSNFLIYCFMGQKFKQVLLAKMGRFWRITESGPKRNTAANQVREGDKRSSPQTEKNSAGVIKSVTATTNLLESKV